MVEVTNRQAIPKLGICPNCKENSLSIFDAPLAIHQQCLKCGYAIFKEHKGLDENDKAIITEIICKEPIGCATLKFYGSPGHIISIPTQQHYESFLTFLIDNMKDIESCVLSSFKDNVFKEQDLMILK